MIAFSAVFALISAAVFLLAKTLDKRVTLVCALGAAVYLGLDDFVTGLPAGIRRLDVLGGHWNWTGKLLSLVFSALVIWILRLRPETVGITFRWRNGRLGLIALAFFVVWGACLGLLFKPGSHDLETLAFQATMPGLAEELVYRGILPAILLWRSATADAERTPWVIVVATAVAFGVLHGLQLSGGKLGFEVLPALFPFLGSIIGGWLRFKTRSLVFPIAAHGIANVAFQIAGGLRG